ncbi:uncharacterized protein LOC135958964 [Calliphora vicina]|uniref:uncharacterized protein LOC135958964 n=1 Tax=Calliphora vicina TaxID=7373 RepID=UPI00325A8E7F
MTDAQKHEAKYQEMQKYVPFLQRVIEKLKVNNEQQTDNPRQAQLQKMEMLYDLLTNKAKKIKMETLIKCEGVVIKLQSKIEKQTNLLQNEDPILTNVKLKQQMSNKPSTSTTNENNVQEAEDISGPASPPPEIIPDDIEQPVVIPTERRCSPILVNKRQHVKEATDSHASENSKHSTTEQFLKIRQKVFSADHNQSSSSSSATKHIAGQEKQAYHPPHHYDSRQGATTYNAKEHQTQHSKHLNTSRQNSPLSREKPANKPPTPAPKLQTVKVVITEPLPAHVKQQHFPTASQYLPRASICHNNLRTLPQVSQTNVDHNEAYSPEELWDQYNESHKNKPHNTTAPSTPPVFSRLGAKVPDNSNDDRPSTSKASGRYTPIPDVLKSPPLSVSDINNLLIESGADKIPKDISEIGCRRTPKPEDNQRRFEASPTNNSFEVVRKKLAQSARMNSPLSADKEERNMSPLPNERIALKYNPHPRQERLQSMSSTDGSECSTQSKINDPRIKLKMHTNSALNSPTQVATSPNVNVLPAINFNDPRLKKQNLLSLTATPPPAPVKIPAPATPPTHTSTPVIGFRIKDPRISRNHINPLCAMQTPPARRPSVNQTQYSSEENWDSEPEEKSRPPNKVDPRLAKREHQHPYESNCANLTSKPPPNRRNSMSQSRFQMDSAAAHNRAVSQPRFQMDSSAARSRSASQPRFQMNARPNNRASSQPRFDKPNCSKPDTEENWDSDDDTNASINNSFGQTNQQMKQNQHKQSLLNKETDTVPKSKKQRNRLLPAITHTVPNPPNSDTEEDWDSEPEITNDKPKSLTNIESEGNNVKPKAVTQLSCDKSPGVPPVMPAFHTQISPKGFASPIHSLPSPVPHNPYNQSPYSLVSPHNNNQFPVPHTAANNPLVGPHNHSQFPMPNTAANNRFSSVLNDKSERIKYFEAKKQKSVQPRTYKEFREARERAQAQEAAIKRAADEAEAKKRAAELKEANKGKEITIQESEKKEQPKETPKKLDECKKDKKPNQIETTKATSTPSHQDHHKKATGAAESTLDKMYRTQNFNSSFPKSVTAFKIPKKKTEEKIKEPATKTNEVVVPPKQPETEVITEKTKSQSQESKDTDKGKNNKCNNNKKASEPAPSKPLVAEDSDKIEQNQVKPKGIKENSAKTKMAANANSSQKEKPSNEAPKDKQEKQTEATEDKSDKTSQSNKIETENNEKDSQKSHEQLNENKADKTAEDNKKTIRDPRCRPKPPTKVNQTINEQEQDKEKQKEPVSEKFKMFEEIVITSAENEVTLKPQQNLSALDKFNKLTQELTPKPQRILRRRNTMVVFDSAPLVDKEKLRKANALLFEDVHDEEKRKRKQAEEERITARRNKHLEEMFKKTDDNCTVSTQNIITGKRRTRATINFNETANAINVFKHISVKDTSLDNVNGNTTSHAAQFVKTNRSNSKIKMKNLEEDKSDDENSDITASKSNNKDTAKTNKETKAAKTKAAKETKAKEENKTEEPQPEPKTKTQKKRMAANKKVNASNNNKEDSQTPAAANNEDAFMPIPDEEHQNSVVSSTSTENSAEEEASCSNTSNNRSFKKESDDNEPTSTANKSNNPTPTPEANVHVLNEIVDQILKPNADREHILGLLGQILSEDRLEVIKSLIESSNRQQTEEQPANKDETIKPKAIKEEKNISQPTNKKHDEEEFEPDELEPLKPKSAAGGKKINMPKKKRSELDRLNEDIRDMFICEGVLTATGRRMCTIMGKEVETEAGSKSTKETTPAPLTEPENTNKRKEDKLKPPLTTRPLRRSLRSCKTNEETEDDALSILSRTTEESMDDFSTTTDTSTTMDTTPQRKMPILKPHTPIKIPEEVTAKVPTTKEPANKRKSDNKSAIKAKKSKTNHNATKDDSETEEKESETEVDEDKDETETKNETNAIVLKNTNIHWHTQSKFTTWCMICDKRIPANASSLHYNIHHGENYISRMAPVFLQRFKQGKLNQPLFGVKKAHKQSSWFYRCPFCLKYFNTPMSLWLEHFQNHTVELRYECSKCHRCSNRRPTISRHIRNCEGATILNSMVKLNVPTAIQAHVCHLCNFIQLKRFNLERHYVEQHHLDKKTVELLGYTITLFDVENVECVTEDKAAERENEAWQMIEKDEQVIDLEDEEDEEATATKDNAIEKEDAQTSKEMKKEKGNTKPAKETEHKDEPETAKEVEEKLSEVEVKNQKAKRILDLDESSGTTNQNNEKEVVAKPIQSKDSNKLAQNNGKEVVAKPIQSKDSNKLAQNLPGKDETSRNENISLNNQASDKQQVIGKATLTKSLNVTQPGVQKAAKYETKQKKETTNTLDTSNNDKINTNNRSETPQIRSKTAKAESLNKTQPKELKVVITTKQIQNSDADADQSQKDIIVLDLTDSEPTSLADYEVISEKDTYQDLQDELLALAAEAAEREDETENEAKDNNSNQTHEKDNTKEIAKETPKDCANTNYSVPQPQTTMSDLISSSIDMIYKRGDSSKRKSIGLDSSESKKPRQTASNAFMPTRDENNYSPTIQILAQSIINIEDDTNEVEKTANKPITMAERLSQRLKDSQNQNTTKDTAAHMKPKENAFEKLINDTLLELEKEKDSVASSNSNSTAQTQVLEKALTKASKEPLKSLNTNDIITVISDDEDWEDIEITETAPTATSTNAGNIQKSKNKGLFQKFGMFKGNNTKSKKHLPPMVFMPKKKTKEKPLQSTTTPSSPSPTTTTTTTATKANNTNNLTASSHVPHTNCNAHLGFKPVINIMDDLLPDSPCNDPIDLVPELAPLEPLQDLNDISSILDSNLSAVNINAADHHTSIEDALDFISEQQANDKQKSKSSALKCQGKSVINNISHVGYSVQTTGENAFKFYCLLQNCSFLYSSDSVGLETHFMCEHAQVKWNGYCLICQTQCFPNAEASTEYSITKEIQHMVEKHANKQLLELNTDSTQHSTTSSQGSDERPKIKLRRMTGDCLSRATPDIEVNESASKTNDAPAMSMLGALLVAKPKPPTKDMPPQPQMPLTEPLLLDNNTEDRPFRNVNGDFAITSVTSAANKQTPLQISNVVSLNRPTPTNTPEQLQMPKISNVRTLAPKAGSLWSQQIEKERHELVEAAAESLEVSRILANAGNPSTEREVPRAMDDSPVIVAETVPLAQATTGDFVVTQTVSAQYNEFSSAALGFNISIAASTSGNSTAAPTPNLEAIPSITSRQYKCMGSGCKFVSRVPVAMSDHLRFHERRNFSNKQDYLACGFCFYCASDIEDYMKHADQFHIINKTGCPSAPAAARETDTATSLTKKIHDILNSSNNTTHVLNRNVYPSNFTSQHTPQVQDTEEVYLKKLRDTIDETVGPTGLTDDKLYRCVIKSCHTQLTEGTFISHIMYHISTMGGNPNNFVFKCPHCRAQYQRPAGIKAHIKNHARNRFFCYICEQTSTNPGQLLKHFSEKHWNTLNMYTKELLKPKTSTDGSEQVLDSGYYVAYTQELTDDEVRKFGEKLILEWQRKKSGSKTHFKSSEIDLLPLPAIFQREVNCGECKYKTKVRTNMVRHLQMHKQNPMSGNKTGAASNVNSVDPVNPVPCLNSSERFFDKMTNLASSSLIPSTSTSASGAAATSATKSTFKIPYCLLENKCYTCGCYGCNYHTISEVLFRTHMSTLHSTATTFRCTFCQEQVCKKGITMDRILNHLRFHGSILYRCEECNYIHYLRHFVEKHINDRHASLKVNIVTHQRSSEDNPEGTTTALAYTGRKYKETLETDQPASSTSTAVTRSSNSESSVAKPIATYGNTANGKGKWVCDVCGQKANTVGQIQTHCQQQHGVKNQYKCAHCNFGSQQLSQILSHIDDKHSGKTREACYMYHKSVNTSEEVTDTRPLWQRNDPTRVRHIRGILMEDEELALSEDVDDEDQQINVEELDEEVNNSNYLSGYEFGCYHCGFKTQMFENLRSQHYMAVHCCHLETAKPFWYRLHRRLCCPECRAFIGNNSELQQHLQNEHKKTRFYAADITMAENEDSSQRVMCGYCSFHCSDAESLHRHHLRVQHWPQDIRIDNDEQFTDILALGKPEPSYQCTLCADVFPNRVAIVQHACNVHSVEEGFSFRELTNVLIFRCNNCWFTSTNEIDLLRHMIDHYSRFKICNFCNQHQTSFNVYMQHCYAEHRNDIQRFRTIYPFREIRKFLLQMLLVFPSGLVLNKRNLLNTKYGRTEVIDEIYEEIYKISQQPPIPRLSIARLVARKSIEAQQKPTASAQDEVLEAMQSRPKPISKRRRTVVLNVEDLYTNNSTAPSLPKAKVSIKAAAPIAKRRTTVDHENLVTQQQQQQQEPNEFNAPLQQAKISKRRRTVAVDRDTLFSTNLSSNSAHSLLIEKDVVSQKKRKTSHTPSPKHIQEPYPLNLDLEPFSFYGQTPEKLDLSKIHTKVAIGGIQTPITLNKFKLLVNIDCQLKLTKCDEDSQTNLNYKQYKHIKKACPASHKLKFNN